jgi:hypothetical protein
MSEEPQATDKKPEEGRQIVEWILGLIYAGLAWLLWKGIDWAYGSTEPRFWWDCVKAVYAVAACALGVYQIYRIHRAVRRQKSNETAKAEGSINPASPSTELVSPEPARLSTRIRRILLHIGMMIVCFFFLGIFIAVCVAWGYVVETAKEWVLSPFK